MLAGAITPKELAHDDEELYFDEKTRENIKKNQLAQLEESRTGFYDEMKKNINKDACEECRFCHKKNAFCEDMKQIRASDEPMTRFMRCNACNKAWRD
jgi:transcription elongation factor S-II